MKTSQRGINDPLDAILRSVERLSSLTKRFWSKVDRGNDDECWPWTAATTERGYGRMTAGRGVSLKAPRVAYAVSHFISPGTWDVCHECDNPRCCNPSHLFLGKPLHNVRDAMAKGRMRAPPVSRGEAHHAAKFSASVARIIRSSRDTMANLATTYGVSTKTIYRIKHGLSRAMETTP